MPPTHKNCLLVIKSSQNDIFFCKNCSQKRHIMLQYVITVVQNALCVMISMLQTGEKRHQMGKEVWYR